MLLQKGLLTDSVSFLLPALVDEGDDQSPSPHPPCSAVPCHSLLTDLWPPFHHLPLVLPCAYLPLIAYLLLARSISVRSRENQTPKRRRHFVIPVTIIFMSEYLNGPRCRVSLYGTEHSPASQQASKPATQSASPAQPANLHAHVNHALSVSRMQHRDDLPELIRRLELGW